MRAEQVGHQPGVGRRGVGLIRLGDRVEQLERVLGLADLEVDVGDVAGVLDQAGIGGRGPPSCRASSAALRQLSAFWTSSVGLLVRFGRLRSPEHQALFPVRAADPGLGLDPLGRARADRFIGRDRLRVLAKAVVDLAQDHPRTIALLVVGPGFRRVVRQVDQPVQVARSIDLAVRVIGVGQGRHADLGRLGREAPLRIAPGQVLAEDVGLIKLLIHVKAECHIVARVVGLVVVLGRVGAADGLPESATARSHSWAAMAWSDCRGGVLVAQVGDARGALCGLGLVLLEQRDRLGLERRGVADDLAEHVDDLPDRRLALGGLGGIGELREDVLGQLELHAESLARGFSSVLGNRWSQRDRFVGRQRVLLPLAVRDDLEVGDVALERPQARVGVVDQLVVDPQGGADFALLLVALALPHPRGQPGPLGPVVLVNLLELLEPLGKVVGPLLGAGRIRLPLLVVDDRLLKLGIHHGGVAAFAPGLARVVVGEEVGKRLELGREAFVGLDVGGAGLVERRPRLDELGVLLGLVLGLLAEQDRQVAALDEQAGQLHQRLGGELVVGLRLGERVEPVRACSSSSLAAPGRRSSPTRRSGAGRTRNR